jgi:hypothetical protein
MILDLVRGLVAGAVTVLVFRALPRFTFVLGIPLCVLMFLAISVAVRFVNRRDFELLMTTFRKPAATIADDPPGGTMGVTPGATVNPAAVDPLSGRAQ